MTRKTVSLITLLTVLATLGFGQDLNTTLEVAGLDEAGPPRVVGEYLLFTYQFAGESLETTRDRIHAVEVAFSHENFSILRSFARNDQGVFVYLHPLDGERTTYDYRLVVDGIWSADPLNPSSVTDRWGIGISRTTIAIQERQFTETPVALGRNQFAFLFLAPEGSQVNLVGTFNGWDPYMTELAEVEPGLFSRTIRLGPGEHLYYFLVDGLRISDPTNSERRWHSSGTTVSVVMLP